MMCCADHFLCMGLGFFIGGFLGDQLLGLGLGLTDQPPRPPCLAFGDELIAGNPQGLRLLQLPVGSWLLIPSSISRTLSCLTMHLSAPRGRKRILHHII